MSEREPDGPYIYQPFGMQHKLNWAAKRIYAIEGVNPMAKISGLTKSEAITILDALKSLKDTA